MFLSPDLHILKLPDFFKTLHSVYDGCDLPDEGRCKASSRTVPSKNKHGFLPLR